MSQAGEWETKAYQMHELRTRAVRVLAETDDSVWAGQAAQAWRERVEQLAGELASFAQQLMDRSTAMRFFAGQVEQIADDARLWRVRVHEPEYRAQATMVLDRLAEERRGADARVCAELTVVRVGSWAATAAGLEAVGVCTPGQIDPWSITARLRDWARAFDGGSLSQRDAQDLGALLRAWVSDGEAMGVFFSTLGGQGTLDLLAAICDTDRLDQDQALSLAGLVRAGLATGSGTWGTVTAEGFAAGLLDPLADSARSDHDRMRDLWSVSFLLGDAGAHPVAAFLATALADRVDLIERTRTQDAIWLNPPSPSMVGVAATAALVGLVLGGDPTRPYASVRPDVAGLVFEHLGAHPDAALAWVTSTAPDVDGAGTAGVARVDHWFASRDWERTGDYFAGPVALWRGAVNATGGPADPDVDDPDVWKRVAAAMSTITTAITTNPAFLPENVSELATVQLTGVLAAQLACLTEVPIGERSAAAPGGVETNHFPGLDDPRWVASLTREQLAVLIGIATSSPAGIETVRAVVTAQQNALLGAAGTPGGYPPDEAITRIATLQTILDAAPAGAAAGAAARQDARVQTAIDTISLGLSLTKIPGLDRSISALATAAADLLPPDVTTVLATKAVTTGRTWLADQAAGAWAATHSEAVANGERGVKALQTSIEAWARQLQVPEVGTTAGGEVEEYAQQKTSSYDELYGAFTDYAEQR